MLRYLVSNGEAVTFDDVTITVQGNEPSAPTITSAPTAQIVPLGDTALFSVIATGHPTPVYQWFFNDALIDGAEDSNLHIAQVNFENEGLYHVRVSNELGQAQSAPVWLEVAVPLDATGYNAWAAQLPAGQRGKAQVFGGVPNLLRYALGGTVATPRSQLQLRIHPLPSGVQLTFNRVADPTLTYEIWRSEDLMDWGSLPVWLSIGAHNAAGEVTFTDSIPEAPPARRFFRLQVRD